MLTKIIGIKNGINMQNLEDLSKRAILQNLVTLIGPSFLRLKMPEKVIPGFWATESSWQSLHCWLICFCENNKTEWSLSIHPTVEVSLLNAKWITFDKLINRNLNCCVTRYCFIVCFVAMLNEKPFFTSYLNCKLIVSKFKCN